jgi:hypothetical protein
METSRHKAIVMLSSDHAGINQALGWLEYELRRALARIEDPRKVRDYLRDLGIASRAWCDRNAVDGRGWQERFSRKRA